MIHQSDPGSHGANRFSQTEVNQWMEYFKIIDLTKTAILRLKLSTTHNRPIWLFKYSTLRRISKVISSKSFIWRFGVNTNTGAVIHFQSRIMTQTNLKNGLLRQRLPWFQCNHLGWMKKLIANFFWIVSIEKRKVGFCFAFVRRESTDPNGLEPTFLLQNIMKFWFINLKKSCLITLCFCPFSSVSSPRDRGQSLKLFSNRRGRVTILHLANLLFGRTNKKHGRFKVVYFSMGLANEHSDSK